jgi:WD40 repeat protein
MNVCWSKDDSLLLAAGNDQTARLYSFKAARLEHTLLGHTNKIYAAALEGEIAITASYDRTMKMWNLSGGACTRTIPCHSSCNSLSVSSHSGLIATGHLDGHVRIWALRSGELMKDLDELHTQQVTSVEFSKDGYTLLTNSRDNAVKLIDIRTFRTLTTLEGSAKEAYRNSANWNRASWSPDAMYAMAGAASGSVFIWKTETGKLEAVLPPAHWPIDPVTGQVMPPGTRSPSTSLDGGTHSLAAAAAAARGSGSSGGSDLPLPGAGGSSISEHAIVCVDWCKNGRQLASCEFSGGIFVWGEVATPTAAAASH